MYAWLFVVQHTKMFLHPHAHKFSVINVAFVGLYYEATSIIIDAQWNSHYMLQTHFMTAGRCTNGEREYPLFVWWSAPQTNLLGLSMWASLHFTKSWTLAHSMYTTKTGVGCLRSPLLFSAWMSQPLLAPLNNLGYMSLVARVMSTNPLFSAMLMVNSSYCWSFKLISRGLTLLHLHSRLTA
jgi:hypothetical protein